MMNTKASVGVGVLCKSDCARMGGGRWFIGVGRAAVHARWVCGIECGGMDPQSGLGDR